MPPSAFRPLHEKDTSSWKKFWAACIHYSELDGLTCGKLYSRTEKRVGEELMRENPRSAARKNKGDFKKDAENTNVNVKKNVRSIGRWSSCCRILQIGLEKTPEAVTKEQIICLTVSRTEWSNKAFPFFVSGTGKLMLDVVPNHVHWMCLCQRWVEVNSVCWW